LRSETAEKDYRFRVKVTTNIRKMSDQLQRCFRNTQYAIDFWGNPKCFPADLDDVKSKSLMQDYTFKGKRVAPFFLFDDQFLLLDKTSAASWVTAIEECGGKAETVEVPPRPWDAAGYDTAYKAAANSHLKIETPPTDDSALPDNNAVKAHLINWAFAHKLKVPEGKAPLSVMMYSMYSNDHTNLFPASVAGFLAEFLTVNGAKVSVVTK